MKNHFKLMAAYNLRINKQIYKAALELDKSDLEKDMGAFFGSVLATLNHIMVGDLLWLSRIEHHSDRYESLSSISEFASPSALNDILYQDIDDLHEKRNKLDGIIVDWVGETEESDFHKLFSYKNMKGKEERKVFGEVVSHFFNHQTHHRGQVSTLLNQLGKDVGITDFIIDIPRK